MANAKRTPAAKPTTPPSARPAANKTASAMPTEDDIRVRAYEIWRSRGSAGGNPEDDWAQAQRELGLELRPPM